MRCRLAALSALLLWLVGCGGGETVPLISPSGNCDQAVDPRWQLQAGFFGEENIHDTAWPPGGRPVVVGSGGFIAENEAPGSWHREESGVWVDLTTLVQDGAGGLLAIGMEGGTLRRPDGTWQPVSGLPSGSWNDHTHGMGAYWLAGYSGLLVRVDADARCHTVPVPTTNPLMAVLAETDSLFVMGWEGFCQVRVGEDWAPLDFPVPADGYARYLYRLDDGRLLLVTQENGGTFHVREDHGWVLHPEVNPDQGPIFCRYEDGDLWVRDGDWQRWDVSGETWTAVTYPGADDYSVAIGPDGELLQSDNYRLEWFREDSAGRISRTPDPAVAPAYRSLFRLLDGTVVASDEGQIHIIEATGSRPVRNLETVDRYTLLAGVSLEDFFLLADGLFHYREGQGLEEVPLPETQVSWNALAVNTTGQIMLNRNDNLCVWDGSGWHCLLEDVYINERVFTTRHQTLVALGGDEAIYLGPEGPVRIALPFYALGVSEPEPGRLMFLSRYLDRCLYGMGTGIIQELDGDAVPGCDDIWAFSFAETEQGGMAATGSPSLVLGVTVSGAWAEWELVAGPWTDEIEDLQVLADGSLAALDDASGRLLIHPAPGN